MKKILSALLCAISAASISSAAFAAGDPEPRLAVKALVCVYGNITDEADDQITVSSETDGSSFVISISDTAFIIDALTGGHGSINQRSGDRVAAYYKPPAESGITSQNNAVAIIVNLPEKKHSPHYAIVEEIESHDDKIRVLTNSGSIYVSIMRDAPISPFRTLNIVTPDDINVGAELLLWYDMVAQSYPGQATSLKTVVLALAPSEDITPVPDGTASDKIILVPEAGVASVNGAEVNLINIHYKGDGTLTLPLRQLCEALGYEVKWKSDTATAEITRGEAKVVLGFGSNTYQVNGSKITLDFVPEVEDGVTFVPTAFFESMPGVELITLSKAQK